MQYGTYHELLIEEFDRRKAANAAYSLRAYARDLAMSAPRLSQVLSKKQGLSIEAAEEVATRLKLPDNKRQWFCHSVGAQHARSFKERANYKEKILKYQSEAKVFSEIQLEYFKVIADWWHFGILELTYHQEFRYDLHWISEVLDITPQQTEEAIKRMLSLDLLKEENGTLKDVFKFLATPSDIPSSALKKFNSQLMKRALLALYEQDVHHREIASNIFSIDKASIPVIKEKLRAFRRELEHEASKAPVKNAVYCLGMQFFELTKDKT